MSKGGKIVLILVALVSFAAGIAFEYAFMTYLWPNRRQIYTWTYARRNHREPGEPCQTDLMLDRQGYSLGYSFERRAALWVSYIITADSVGIDVGRHSSFFADSDIPEAYRTKPDDYVNTGYDKGHQAPSAAIDFSKTANRETFALSNITLQDQKLNREAWGTLEELERKWTEQHGKIYVVTGPLYTTRPKKVNGIPIPSKYYKVIYSYDADKAIGFILPNRAVPNGDLWQYAMSVQDVEKKTDLKFFSKFSAEKQKKLKDTVDIAWWQGTTP